MKYEFDETDMEVMSLDMVVNRLIECGDLALESDEKVGHIELVGYWVIARVNGNRVRLFAGGKRENAERVFGWYGKDMRKGE